MLEPGLALLARELPAFLQGARVGLVAHPASIAFVAAAFTPERSKHRGERVISLRLKLLDWARVEAAC